jgi:NTE family protein
MRADGVFSGGGVKGIAFAGAIQAAEEAGYDEWVRLAGTSAGAIAAAALAVGYDAAGIRALLEDTDYQRLADYGGPLGAGRVYNWLFRRGLTRGRALREWIEAMLKGAPRPAERFGELDGRLQVVGTDVAHARLVVFPDDVALYQGADGRPLRPEEFPIADAVRISAGYPFFFPPLALRDRASGKDGALVDGGVASAFPLFVFDKPDPQHPTWGFRLHDGMGVERPHYHEIGGLDWPVEMAQGILDTAMNAFDTRDLMHFGDRSVSIPTGNVETLDFSLSAKQREFLYRSGYETAKAFFDSRPSARNSFGALPASGRH